MVTQLQLERKNRKHLSNLYLKSFGKIGLASFALVTIVKIILMISFSSGYMRDLFIPFVQHYLTNLDNPWDFFFSTTVNRDQFPYQSLMLFLLAFTCLPLKILGWSNPFFINFFMKLPILLSDISITVMLSRMFPTRLSMIFWCYYLSPIVLYACYLHSQLDLIPTAIFFGAIYFLRQHKWIKAAVLTGLSIATKTHVLAGLPLLLVFMYRNQSRSQTAYFAILVTLTALAFILPFWHSPGFQALVIHNVKQREIFDAYLSIGSMKVYLPIFAVFIAYGRFALYSKVNTDLLDAFVTIVFSLFMLFMAPAPGWYVWIAPFLSLFMIKYYNRHTRITHASVILYFVYLAYFLFFHQFDHTNLIFLGQALISRTPEEHLTSVAFTMLEVVLAGTIVICYRTAVKSNLMYKKDKAIVIGIGGDSGSGKSTLLQDIKTLLKDKLVELEGDADHKWERDDTHWTELTHLDPKSNFLHRQAETIFNLKRGLNVHRADYNHETGKFVEAQLVQVKDFVVLSGLHTFYLPKLRKAIDLKIFMDPHRELQTHWKLRRDIKERGYSPDQVTAQMNRRKTDVDRFIAPQRDFADIAISYFCDDNFNSSDLDSQTQLCLKISMSSSIYLDGLMQDLMQLGLSIKWDYSADLTKQEFILSEPVPTELLVKFANDMIPNLEEIAALRPEFQDGYRGFVQLMILLALTELMKEKEENHET
jgi:uridine kinase